MSPCIAVFPVILSVAPGGAKALILSSLFFAIGVFGALTFASMLVYRGIMKLDHPIFEHYGDVISGGAIALVGLVLALI